MLFLFWVKDEEGRYLWGNRTTSQLVEENVVGKSDQGRANLSVCKFLGEFEGETRVFGVSFVIDE
jgi:hypothetical protein